MKKFLVCAILTGMIFSPFAFASDYSLKALSTGNKTTSAVSVHVAGDVMTLSSLNLVKAGPNPDNMFYLADRVKLQSGIKGSRTGDDVIFDQRVENGQVQVQLLNFAKESGIPCIEHFYGMGNSGTKKGLYLLLSADNPWVCYKNDSSGRPDLNTLFIGVVNYADGTFLPLKLVLQKLGLDTEGTYAPQDKDPRLAALTSAQKNEISNTMGLKK